MADALQRRERGELGEEIVVLLEARCACGCGAPFARTPPVLRFSNQHCRLSHRLSVCRACYRSPAHLQTSFNRCVASCLSQQSQSSPKARTLLFVHRLRGTSTRLSATSSTIQPLYNRFSTPRQLSETSTHQQPSFNRHLNHSPTTFQPPLVRFSPVVRPTFCRTHSPTSHPHFTYSAHITPSPIRRADLRQPSFNHHLNHSPTTFQPPPTRSSPSPPPICRDKDGHPLPSHAAPKIFAHAASIFAVELRPG